MFQDQLDVCSLIVVHIPRGMTAHRTTASVLRRRGGDLDDLVARLFQTDTEVRVLSVDKKVLVEKPDPVQRMPADEHVSKVINRITMLSAVAIPAPFASKSRTSGKDPRMISTEPSVEPASTTTISTRG